MILLDILIWAILLFFVAKGFSKGLVREACSLLGLVLGGWAAFRYYPSVAQGIKFFINLPPQVAQPLSFLLVFLLLGILFYFLGHLFTVVFKIMLLGGINRIGGIVFGFLEGGFVLCVLLYLGTTKPVPDKLKGWISHSRTAQSFAATGASIAAGWEHSKVAKGLTEAQKR
ncbi:CvpA family protein [Geomesophilobacter sediminis]|uniref:CvpA family protein n=1 Tax=Geomesophilobacter sediminis TaxID=2798584 RepID=A0A8J7JD09_9BACT|nr:CvpA family protein [Geomesophilobacter sediminis]MBJ6724868.1 CvpA family protein [Geomesophilobacter sediminis]